MSRRTADQAEEIRHEAQEHDRQLREREARAEEAEAKARKARAEAEQRAAEAKRLEAEAERRGEHAETVRAERDEQLRRADARDPDVRTDNEGYRIDERRQPRARRVRPHRMEPPGGAPEWATDRWTDGAAPTPRGWRPSLARPRSTTAGRGGRHGCSSGVATSDRGTPRRRTPGRR